MFKKFLSLAAVSLTALPVLAQVAIAPVFSDNMVLQREKDVAVWGSADPGENVTVSFAGQTVSAAAGNDGRWLVKLAPMPANAKGAELTVKGKSNTVSVKNILVGEVWLCSGQSNMEMPMWTNRSWWRATDGDKHAKAGANPQIRITTFKPYGFSSLPQTAYPAKWEELNAENGLSFSATAFYFGQELFKALNVPIGLVSSNWGGTRIEPWIPPCGFDSVPELKDIAYQVNCKLPGTPEYAAAHRRMVETYTKYVADANAAAAAGQLLPQAPAFPPELQPYNNRQQTTVLYNHMIHPWVPFTFRGVIWYQGCSNLRDGSIYQQKMQALLNGWRKVFNDPDMPFYFVQLAPFTYGGNQQSLPVIWEAQEKFARSNRNVGMAVINDIGNLRDIHPHDKLSVGRRLGLLALKYTYGKKELKADSPIMTSWKIEGNSFVIEFENVEKWVAKGEVTNFEVASSYGTWAKAVCRIDGSKLIVSSPEIEVPVQLRYMWKETCEGNLFNEVGLPLGAFRCGKNVGKADIFSSLEKTATLIYQHNMLSRMPFDGSITYQVDNSDKFVGKPVKRIIYAVELIDKKCSDKWVVVSMDAFTADVKKIGVPAHKTGAVFFTKVTNLTVYSNVAGVKTGVITTGNIEFCGSNYAPLNKQGIPGASNTAYDFGDAPITTDKVGHGSLQIHNFAEKQTIFSYNNFTAPVSSIGIGNAPGANPDWTFVNTAGEYTKAVLKVYAEF